MTRVPRTVMGALLGIVTGATVAPLLAVAVTWRRVHRDERRALGWSAPPVGTGDPEGTAVVVLGTEAFPSGPGADLASRLEHGIRLWRAGVGRTVLVSGGVDDRVDEVEVMSRYLRGRGLPEGAVVPARPGQNTRASVSALTVALSAGVASRFVVVSTAFHAHRILAECRRNGVPAEVAAPPDSPEMVRSALYRARIATEVIASIAYALPPAWMARIRTSHGSLRHSLPRVLGRQQSLREAVAQARDRASA